jgi:bla regulator protein blaR1
MALRPTVILALAAASLFAQKSFEVASIKPNAENDHRVMFRILPGGGFSATGTNLRMLIMQAYNVKDFQVTGGPGWMISDRYDVNAKAEATTERVSPDTFRPMLQSLLAERFQLKFHKETKEMPVYALVAGKGPHKMKASETPAGANPQQRQMMRIGRGQANLQGTTMAGLAQLLSQQLGRPVIDKTGIQGTFDVEMHWTPEPGQGGGPFGGGAPPPPDAIAQSDTSGPSIFTAVQEQLGLKLDSTKGPVEIMVIDSASKPTEN